MTQILATIDIGSTKISCFIAEREKDDISLIGFAQISSFGISRGVVTNMHETARAIGKVVDQASNMAGVDVESVNICVGGVSIKSKITDAMLVLNSKVINEDDIEKLLDIAKAKHIENDKKILHSIAIEYTLDDYAGIKSPLSMVGSKLEAKVNIVSIKKDILKNIVRAVEMAGYYIENIIASNVANGYSALVEDERVLGACLIDFGGFSTDISIYYNGKLVYVDSIGVGSYHVTSDMAKGLSCAIDEAERLKSLDGVAVSSLIESGRSVEFVKVGDSSDKHSFVSHAFVSSIIQPRVEEIFERVAQKVLPYKTIFNNRVVLTGGGANLKGISEMGQLMLNSNVRVADVNHLSGLSKISKNRRFITVAGGTLYLHNRQMKQQAQQLEGIKVKGFLFAIKKSLKNLFITR